MVHYMSTVYSFSPHAIKHSSLDETLTYW